jgi:hypothetical protein
MLFESIAALASSALIGALALRRKRKMDQSGNATQDWPGYEKDRREYAEQMRVAGMVEDARFILDRQYSGKTASRREMVKLGLPERRWKPAVMLLRSLHIYAPKGYTPIDSEYHAMRKLERHQRTHAARIKHSPAAYVAP